MATFLRFLKALSLLEIGSYVCLIVVVWIDGLGIRGLRLPDIYPSVFNFYNLYKLIYFI